MATTQTKKPKLSIVVPVMNHLYYTRQLLGFIKHNTNVPHEVIVINDKSVDDTAKFLLKAKKKAAYKNLTKFTVVTNGRNMGITHNWNKGISVASAEHVAIVNNDIILPPRWAELALEVFKRDKAIQCLTPIEKREVPIDQYWGKAKELAGDWLMWETVLNPPALPQGFCGSCFVLRKSAWKQLGRFDKRFKYWYGDIDLYLRLSEAGCPAVRCLNILIHHFGGRTVNAMPEYLKHFEKDGKEFREKWAWYDEYRQFQSLAERSE